MAFQPAPWVIDGATTDAIIARLQLQAGTRSQSGVIGATDLQVTALPVPGQQVQIASGGLVAVGQEAQWQGSYFAYNVGTISLTIQPTGATARSDLIVARIEDPTVSGSPWSHNPATDPLVYAVVLSGVSSTATAMPPGQTGVPLARIDLPANTSAVTQAMIHNLRGSVPDNQVITSYQANPGAWNSANAWVDYSAANWPPITFTVPPSGKIWVSICASIRGTANGNVGWRLSGADTLAHSFRHAVGGAGLVRATRRVIIPEGYLTPGAVNTITPGWYGTDTFPNIKDDGDGDLNVEMI